MRPDVPPLLVSAQHPPGHPKSRAAPRMGLFASHHSVFKHQRSAVPLFLPRFHPLPFSGAAESVLGMSQVSEERFWLIWGREWLPWEVALAMTWGDPLLSHLRASSCCPRALTPLTMTLVTCSRAAHPLLQGVTCPAAIAVKYNKRTGTSGKLNGLTGQEQQSVP